MSIAAIILSLIVYLKKNSNDDDSSGESTNPNASTDYCNLDQLTIGNFNLTVGKNPKYLILQYKLSTFPFVVFNLKDTNEPIMSVVDTENYFFYDFNNEYNVSPRCKNPDVFAKISELKYPCKRIEKGSITFSNDITLGVINNNQTLLMKGAKSQVEFNATNFPFKSTIFSSGNTSSYCYFDGNYFCTDPLEDDDKASCRGTQPPDNMTLQDTSSSATTDQNKDKVDGISFSNEYSINVSSNSIAIQGPLGDITFNLNDGSDVWTINNYNNNTYMYYNYDNKIGTIAKTFNNKTSEDISVTTKTDNCHLFQDYNKDIAITTDCNGPMNSLKFVQTKAHDDNDDTDIYQFQYKTFSDTLSTDVPNVSPIGCATTKTATSEYPKNGSCNYLDRQDQIFCADNEFKKSINFRKLVVLYRRLPVVERWKQQSTKKVIRLMMV
jgi:hypothetical protein